MSEYKKEIGIAVGVAVVLAVLVGGTAIFLFPSHVSGSFGGLGNGGQFHAIYPTALSCSVENGSCRIVISNNETTAAQAVGCEFQSIHAVNGNNQTLTTVNLGAGVLSNRPGGPATSITIPVNTSLPMYCTVSSQSGSFKAGSPADGEILFTNQSLNVQFLGNWR